MLNQIKAWSFSRKLVLIFVLALVCRLPIVLNAINAPENSLETDSKAYLDLAHNLLEFRTFVATTGQTLTPEIFRTPGYPIFLALFQMVFGDQIILPVVLVQVILAAGTPVFAALVARSLLHEERIGLLTGVLLAVSPNQIISSGFLMTEALFGFLMITSVWLCVRAMDEDNWKLAILSGVLIGVGALVRHVGTVFAAFMILFQILSKTRTFYRYAVPFIISYGLLVFPWMVRNQSVTGHLIFTPQGRTNMEYYVVPSVEAHRLNISIKEARERIVDLESSPPIRNEDDHLEEVNALLFHYITSHPVEFVVFNSLDAAYGLLRPGYSYLLWSMGLGRGKDDPISVFRDGSPTAVISTIVSLPPLAIILLVYTTIYHFSALFLMVIGVVAVIRKKRWHLVALLFALPYFIIFLTGYQSHSRYRVPGDVLTIILTAVGLLAMLDIGRRLVEARRNSGPSGMEHQT